MQHGLIRKTIYGNTLLSSTIDDVAKTIQDRKSVHATVFDFQLSIRSFANVSWVSYNFMVFVVS